MIINEAFLSSAVSNLPSIATGDVIQHIRFDDNASLGFDLVECHRNRDDNLFYLRDKDIGALEFNAVSVEALNPHTVFSADTTHSRNIRPTKQHKTLSTLLDIAARDVKDQGKDQFGHLAYNQRKNEIVICEHRPIRISG